MCFVLCIMLLKVFRLVLCWSFPGYLEHFISYIPMALLITSHYDIIMRLWLDTWWAVTPVTVQGWGFLSQFPLFRYFPNFPSLSKQTLVIEYHIYIWQMSPQLGCGDSCQIWMWFKESNRYFRMIENLAYGEINERSFSNPHPWSTQADPNCLPQWYCESSGVVVFIHPYDHFPSMWKYCKY